MIWAIGVFVLLILGVPTVILYTAYQLSREEEPGEGEKLFGEVVSEGMEKRSILDDQPELNKKL